MKTKGGGTAIAVADLVEDVRILKHHLADQKWYFELLLEHLELVLVNLPQRTKVIPKAEQEEYLRKNYVKT